MADCTLDPFFRRATYTTMGILTFLENALDRSTPLDGQDLLRSSGCGVDRMLAHCGTRSNRRGRRWLSNTWGRLASVDDRGIPDDSTRAGSDPSALDDPELCFDIRGSYPPHIYAGTSRRQSSV
jgi:hypothetical protein